MGKVHPLISRRDFFVRGMQAVGMAALANGCRGEPPIRGEIIGANASLGHRLRDMKFGTPATTRKVDVVIIGGGVAGLSSARFLSKKNVEYVLLELAQEPGGNSIAGNNNVSAFPWGAHYLPIPGNGDPELLEFLSASGVITGVKNGLPVYNDYFLCHDPKERLYINQHWQEGIVPHEGVPKKDREEIERFLELMNTYRNQRGADGMAGFTIPIANCSDDKVFRDLASISASAFLHDNDFTSPFLLWYISYCCADDFGTLPEQTSAWAMIHYFASRNGKAFNAPSDTVLTWPEGNGWLIDRLKTTARGRIVPHALAYNIELSGDAVFVSYYNAATNETVRLSAKSVIMATPQFVSSRILSSLSRSIDYTLFEYAPWMVANITTTHPLSERRGEPLSWDNVIYGSDSLGYINASHQNVAMTKSEKVLTYYKPLTGEIVPRRKEAYTTTYEQWQRSILSDLSNAHRDIRKEISRIDICIWGHGMIAPTPRLLSGDTLRQAAQPVMGKIFFAHSDLSGLSIFEEAFYHGHRAAQELVNYG